MSELAMATAKQNVKAWVPTSPTITRELLRHIEILEKELDYQRNAPS